MRHPYPEILTVEQVAAYLQLSKMTVYKYIREGRLPAAKIGKAYRIRRSDVEAFLEGAIQSHKGQLAFQGARHAVVVPPAAWPEQGPPTRRSTEEVGFPHTDPRRERPEIKDLAALTGNPLEWVIKGLN